ncbi:outer membrane beta-barrel protein [Pleionea sp. CnH1-48]|uniref:outer membrane beta-barrel protein n=1 Tax=Pleionea sp. CnH1-48 TaxID=2954494 RepID=UPI002097BBBC|nr:outer membrane beta-barrel protein [Pleionea sp. CnH1-48]MCO7226285.1 porin family protein [Pleionea sp. CnH1-48]
MKTTLVMALLGTAALFSAHTNAKNYINFNYAQADVKKYDQIVYVDGVGNILFVDLKEQAKPTYLQTTIGHYFNDNWSAELRLGMSASDDQVKSANVFNLTSFDLWKVKESIGIYSNYLFLPHEFLSPFVSVGYNQITLHEFVQDRNTQYKDLSIGLGISARLSDKSTFRFEYNRLHNKDNVEISNITAGLQVSF